MGSASGSKAAPPTIPSAARRPPRNVISNNNGDGINIVAGSNNNHVEGNFIGTDSTGTVKVPNGKYGVHVLGSSNTIGGSSSVTAGNLTGAGNLVSGNTQGGVILQGGSGNEVQGNFVGTDVTGTSAIPNNPTGRNKNNNYLDGIDVIDGSSGAIIGGVSVLDANGNLAGLGNLVSGNGFDGVFIGNWFSSSATESNTVVQGNFIGTTVTGTKKLANYNSGVELGDGAVWHDHWRLGGRDRQPALGERVFWPGGLRRRRRRCRRHADHRRGQRDWHFRYRDQRPGQRRSWGFPRQWFVLHHARRRHERERRELPERRDRPGGW